MYINFFVCVLVCVWGVQKEVRCLHCCAGSRGKLESAAGEPCRGVEPDARRGSSPLHPWGTFSPPMLRNRGAHTPSPGSSSSPAPPVRGAVAASITQTISIYLDANVISPQRSFWNNSHRNCLYMLNEKCADFSEWGLNYSPTTCGSALFTLFIKQGKKKATQSITKQLPERLLQTCCPALKGRSPLIWAELAHGPPAITQRGVLVPVAPTYPPSFLAGFEGSSPGTTPHPRYVPFTPFSQPFCDFHPPFLDRAAPRAATGCSRLAPSFRNFPSGRTVLNAVAVLLQGILR